MLRRYDPDAVSGDESRQVPIVPGVATSFLRRGHRLLITAVVSLAMLAVPVSAHAATEVARQAPGGTVTVTTKSGLKLSVTPTRRLASTGARILVKGRGFDRSVGIYVALCVTPKRGEMPSPCGGGVNMTANDPASAWISSNPPPYGKDLAIPYRPGGRFSVRLTVSPSIGDVDCRQVSCSIVTRADHTRLGERRFDVAVPVTFAS